MCAFVWPVLSEVGGGGGQSALQLSVNYQFPGCWPPQNVGFVDLIIAPALFTSERVYAWLISIVGTEVITCAF